METLEEFYHHKEQVIFDDLTIEHGMPQTLTESWRNQLGDDWETTYELLLHTIGNLTLTAFNAQLSNDSFDAKKVRFHESHLELNKYFEAKQTWKGEDIEKRSAELADMVLAVWPYFGDEKTEQLSHKKANSTSPKALYMLGQSFAVQTWRDVLEQTMNIIADLEPEKFDQIMHQFPRFVGRDKMKFREMRQLKNGMFIEVNLSSQDIHRFCFQVLETIDLSAEDWSVETE